MITEAPPAAAEVIFGPHLPLARRFAEMLATDGVLRGLIGPREPQRMWTRHLLNCAAVAELFPDGVRVVDVGTGAGLPGIAVAICRPDLRVDLIEPLQRRNDFLIQAVADLDLDERVRVVRGRAEDSAVVAVAGSAAWVTARAVAPLDRLVRWCFPLLAPGGRLAAMKGAGAADELAQHRASLVRLGVTNARIVECGTGVVDPPVTVVLMNRVR
jgi:16S rRNA (guanine527-N7)-methyltransferase